MDIKKVIKNLPTGWLEDVEGYDGVKLRETIIEAETALRENQVEMEADEKLSGAKEIVKDLASGYREVVKCQRAKIAYSLHMLAERGEL